MMIDDIIYIDILQHIFFLPDVMFVDKILGNLQQYGCWGY